MKIVQADLATAKKYLAQQVLASEEAQVEEVVKAILADVKENGDRALAHYTEKFDHVALNIQNYPINFDVLPLTLVFLDLKL